MGDDEENVFWCVRALGVEEIRLTVAPEGAVGGRWQFVAAVGEAETARRGEGVFAGLPTELRGVRAYGFSLWDLRRVADEDGYRVFVFRKDRHADRVAFLRDAVACCRGFVRDLYVEFRFCVCRAVVPGDGFFDLVACVKGLRCVLSAERFGYVVAVGVDGNSCDHALCRREGSGRELSYFVRSLSFSYFSLRGE